jgi:hypothetical protein
MSKTIGINLFLIFHFPTRGLSRNDGNFVNILPRKFPLKKRISGRSLNYFKSKEVWLATFIIMIITIQISFNFKYHAAPVVILHQFLGWRTFGSQKLLFFRVPKIKKYGSQKITIPVPKINHSGPKNHKFGSQKFTNSGPKN